MGKQYKKREDTGREYVDKTKEFASITLTRCLLLPKRWEMLTKPLIELAYKAEKLVVMANKVYINPNNQSAEELINAYKMRKEYLTEALRVFAAFDIDFEHLMGHIDIYGAEKRRLKEIFLAIIAEEQNKNPSLQKIEIKVVSRADEMEYESANGDHRLKLKFTPRNKAHWLKTENEAIALIKTRIKSDNYALKKLTEPKTVSSKDAPPAVKSQKNQ